MTTPIPAIAAGNAVRDFLERTFWTALSAALSAVTAATLFQQDTLQAAGVAALTVVINAVTIFARNRAAALPDPGNGLPGLPN